MTETMEEGQEMWHMEYEQPV